MKKLFAFTLAETLIVMGIIGVVAALTIPNLNSSTADKEKIAKVKKLYSNLNDAIGRAEAVYGPASEWKNLDANIVAQTTRFGDRLTEFMKVSKNCGIAANQGCFSKNNTKLLNNSSSGSLSDSQNDIYKFTLADGTSVLCSLTTVYVDIDGPTKGSQTFGKDVFTFTYDENSRAYFPNGNDKSFSEVLSDLKSGSSNNTGGYASSWVINYDNMDYLKLTSDGKCQNGTTPTEQKPSCK